jgi:hypothetical protein
MFCIVQNPKAWLRLVKYSVEPGKKSGKLLLYYLPMRIPYETQDVRFRRAVGYLEHGWKFYIELADHNYEFARQIELPPELINEIKKELANPKSTNILTDDVLKDIHQWFRAYPLQPEEKQQTTKIKKRVEQQNEIDKLFKELNV